ncbi:hypothetical protein C8R46DRAFT_1358238 [Mycena filopes]|nr:hypothetical protein C8R46DRAFT_1358238 [Mycena filopes]
MPPTRKMSSKLLTLPNELLDILAEHQSLGDLLSICRTNRRLYTVCLRWIYRSVVLTDLPRLVGFFQTAVFNTQAAALVRILEMNIPTPTLILKSFGHRMRRALINLIGLVDIALPPSPQILAAISDIRFSRLVHCRIPICHAAPAFLQLHHPTLLRLQMLHTEGANALSLTLPAVRLPHLEIFVGLATVAVSVLPGSRCFQATMVWDPSVKHPSDAVFSALNSPYLRNFCNWILVWDVDMMSAIARHTPNVSALRFTNASPRQTQDELRAFLSSVDDSIAALRKLSVLQIEIGSLPPPSDSILADELAFEFARVSKWGKANPSLKICLLPSQTIWARYPGDMWFPSPETSGSTELLDRLRWVVTAAICSTSPYMTPAYSTILGYLCGAAKLMALKVAYETQGVMPEFALKVAHDTVLAGVMPEFELQFESGVVSVDVQSA